MQHPLAKNWAELEAANLVMMKAAWLYDSGQECGAEANAAKYLAAEAGYRAAEQAVMTHGGMGYAQEYHVERLFRESMLPRHRAGQPGVGALLHCRAGIGPAEVVLSAAQRSEHRYGPSSFGRFGIHIRAFLRLECPDDSR